MKTTVPIFPLNVMRSSFARFIAAGLSAISITLTIVMVFAGCVRQDTEDANLPQGRTFTLPYSFDRAQTRTITAQGNEKIVNDVAMIFYKASDESYAAHQTVTIPGGGGTTVGSFPLQLPAEIAEGVEYEVVIVGNYKNFRPAGLALDDYVYQNQGLTFSQMKEKVYSQSAQGARMTVPLPFYGILTGADGEETTLTGPAPNTISLGVSVKFSRAVARIDLRHFAADRLVIKWAKVCNYRSRGYLYHQDAPLGEIISGVASTPPTDDHDYPQGYVKAPAPMSGEDGGTRQDLTTGGLYAYPNIVGYTAQDDKETTYLMIAGYYQKEGEAANTERLTYYRANIGSNGMSQVLKRNYVYTVVINSVKKEGANDESGAASEKEKLLDYAVDDEWEEDDPNTNSDGLGNFLTLSRTSVLLGNEAGESGTVKVNVKEGTGWSLEWKQNPTSAFRYEKINDKSFSIIANGNNTSQFSNNALLEVRVTGIHPEPNPPLVLDVDVIQLSSAADSRTLIVQGRTGNFDYTVPGQGTVLAFQVVTGSPSSRWKIEGSDGLDDFVAPYETTGANKSYIQLNFLPNGGDERTGKLTVSRLTPDGNVDNGVTPIVISFKQERTPYPMTINPDFSNRTLEIEGFSPSSSIKNSPSYVRGFLVQLADPADYTFEVKSSFNKNTDAYLSLGNPDSNQQAYPHRTDNPNTKDEVSGGTSGQNFYLHVFNTGPGDPDLLGTITITAVPNPDSGKTIFTLSFPVRIRSGCKIGEPQAGDIIWADRNVGAPLKTDSGPDMLGLNYTNETTHNDYENFSYKGAFFSFDEAQQKSVCPQFGQENYGESGWRLPTSAEQVAVVSKMRFSKRRAYILSDARSDGSYVGCWFPLSGYSKLPTQQGNGYFWSSSPNGSGLGYSLYLLTGSASATNSSRSYGYSVRCVR